MNKFKKGDKVRIHCKPDKRYNIGVNGTMVGYDGIVTMVVGIIEHNLTYAGCFTVYRLENDIKWKWTEDMLSLCTVPVMENE